MQMPQAATNATIDLRALGCIARRLSALLLAAAAAASAQAPSAKPGETTAARPVLVARAGGTLSAGAMAVEPHGKWFATVAASGAITIWSTKDGSEYRTFQPFQAYTQFLLQRLAVASDATTIVLAGSTQVHLIDVNTTQEIRQFSLFANQAGPWSIAAHPKQMVLAAIDQQGNASVVSLQDGHELFHANLPTHPNGGLLFLQVKFSPNGNLLTIATESAFEIWDWAANRRILSLDAHSLHAHNLSRAVTWQDGNVPRQSTAEDRHYFWFTGSSFSPDGRHLALCSKDELTILDVPSGKRSAPKPIKSGMMPGCLYLDNDRVALPQDNLDVNILTLSTGATQNLPNMNLGGFLPVPASDLGLVLANSIPSLINFRTGEGKTLVANARGPNSLAFTSDGKQLLWDTWYKPLTSWNLASGEALKFPGAGRISFSAISGNGKTMAYVDEIGGKIRLFDLSTDRELAPILTKFSSFVRSTLSFSFDGDLLVCAKGETAGVEIFSVPDRRTIASVAADHPQSVAMAPDGKQFAVADRSGTTIYSTESPPKHLRVIPTLKADGVNANLPPSSLNFSPDGKWLAVLEGLGVRLFSIGQAAAPGAADGKTIGPSSNLCMAFSPDSRRIAFTGWPNGVEVHDVATGMTVFRDETNLTSCPLAFSPDGNLLALSTMYGVQVVKAGSGSVVVTLYLYGDEDHLDWLAVTPDGLFDGTPGAWSQLGWRFSGNTFDVDPVEIFFREFFRPGLLADIFAGRKVDPLADLAQVDRRQPEVKLSAAGDSSQPMTARQVHLELEVNESRDKAAAGARTGGSGARDLRLFRNGTLVRAWRGDLLLDAKGHAALNADVPIVAGENRFVAYAFNRDNVKSVDAALSVKGADSLERQGTAYVVAIGINEYAAHGANQLRNLAYAEADAGDFGAEFAKQQKRLRQFGAVKLISLLGANATRANIVQALSSLAAYVQPEDGVFVFYAGHGVAAGDHFYLLPQDFNPRVALDDPQANTLSEVDLSRLLEPISPARSFLVIDACNSGEALGGDKFVVGPMNSTGLAQLAYEKGLDILAASQGDESAMESDGLAGGHGYLTYSLVEEGLKSQIAAQDGAVLLRPWFEFASRRVPSLQASMEQMLLTQPDPGAANKPGTRGFLLSKKPRADEQGRQHPRVFYRREPEADPFVVAKPAAAPSPQNH